jgi:hypothetical protein
LQSDELYLERNSNTSLVMEFQTFPPNEKAPKGLNVEGHIRHVKRSPGEAHDAWEDYDYGKLSTLRKNEHYKIDLRATHLRNIFITLLHKYRENGGLDHILADFHLAIVDIEKSVVVTGHDKDLLAQLQKNDMDFWQNVVDLDTSNILEMKLRYRDFLNKQGALMEFANHLTDDDWPEGEWQKFFSKNEWIFGYGVCYQYLGIIQERAYMGGKSITGTGGAEVDYLLQSIGDVRYTVLLDIKTPGANLLEKKAYRNRVYAPGVDLAGGSAQLQNYLHYWSTNGSQDNVNDEEMEALTYRPRGVLVIGRLKQLDSKDKKKSFELFRKSQQGLEIVTFDELYDRARYILDLVDSATTPEGATVEVVPLDHDDWSDVPF